MYGLVLEGGGSRGAYQMGAYKALKDLGINVKYITGTSIGAINGAAIAQGDFKKMFEMWQNPSANLFFDVEKEYLEQISNKNYTVENISYLFKKGVDTLKNKGVETDKLRSVLEDLIDEEKIRKSKINFGLVTFSLTDFKPMRLFIEDIPEGKLVDYLLASASFPGFKLPEINGKKFIDGGVIDNLPVEMLKESDCEKVIAIRLVNRDYKTDDIKDLIVIRPKNSLGRIFNFSPEVINDRMLLGYYDTLRHFENLKGIDYYIREDNEFIRKKIDQIDIKKLKKLCKQYNITDLPPKRALYEKILPDFGKMLDLPKNYTYQDLILGMYEEIAKKLKLKKYKIYNTKEFIKKIEKEYGKSYNNKNSDIKNYLKKQSFMHRIIKEEIIDDIFWLLK